MSISRQGRGDGRQQIVGGGDHDHIDIGAGHGFFPVGGGCAAAQGLCQGNRAIRHGIAGYRKLRAGEPSGAFVPNQAAADDGDVHSHERPRRCDTMRRNV